MSSSQCSNCNNASASLMLCSGCRRVSYCNKACQKSHWKTHKLSCGATAKSGDWSRTLHVWKDPNKPQLYPSVSDLMYEQKRKGGHVTLPFDCITEQRLSNGIYLFTIDEDKFQDKQAKDAAKRARGEKVETTKGRRVPVLNMSRGFGPVHYGGNWGNQGPPKPKVYFDGVDANELVDKAVREGTVIDIPSDCMTEEAMGDGRVFLHIDEEKWKQRQLEALAAKASEAGNRSDGSEGEEGAQGVEHGMVREGANGDQNDKDDDRDEVSNEE